VTPDRKNPEPEGAEGRPEARPESERNRFARFARKLVNVPKKEIDEKAEEWKEGTKKAGSS
jgi:hypothetical protein